MTSIPNPPENRSRRQLLRQLAGFLSLVGMPVIGLCSQRQADLSDEERKFSFKRLLESVMGHSPVMINDGFSLDVPDVAENGAIVPVTLNGSSLSTKDLYLLAEGNPGPMLASFHFSGSAHAKVSLRLKLNQTGPVTALAKMQGGWIRVDRLVKVALGGCG